MANATITGPLVRPDNPALGVQADILAMPQTVSAALPLPGSDGYALGPCRARSDETGAFSLTVPIVAGVLWKIYARPLFSDAYALAEWTVGFFEITATTTLKQLVPTPQQTVATPSQVSAIFDALAQIESGRVAAAGSAAQAATSASAAQLAKQQAQDLVLSDLGTTDGQTRALIDNPNSQVAKGLSATFAPQWKTGTAYTVGQVVLAPDGGTVKVTTAHTAGATYDATKFAIADGVASYVTTRTTQLGVLNRGFTNSNLSKLRRAIARVRAGTADGKLLFVGDSLKWGVGAGGPLKSMPTKLGVELNKRLTTRNGLYIPPSFLPGANAPDSRWATGSGWGQNGNGFGLGAAFVGQAGASGTLVFTPGDGVEVDRMDIYYLRHSGDANAAVTLQASGAAPVTIATGGTSGIVRTTLTFPATTAATVTMSAPVAQPFFIVGVETYSSTRRSLRIGNAGVPSATSVHWTTAAGGSYGPLDCIRAYAADCTWIALGVNDAFVATPTPLATFKNNIQSLITAAKVGGDVILQTCIPVQSSSAMTIQATYNQALAELAASNGCALVDPAARLGSYIEGNALGLYNDTVHLNEIGYTDEMGGYLNLFDLVA